MTPKARSPIFAPMHQLYIILSCLALASACFSQQPQEEEEPKKGWKDRIFTGGGLNLQFGTVTVVGASPILGYMFTDKISAGIGITYLYYQNNTFNYKSSIYGGRLFGRYFVIDQLFLHAEYEVLNLQVYNDVKKAYSREFAPGLLLGAGYSQLVGGTVRLNLMVLWDVIEDDYYPYTNPIIRGGLAFGL